MASNYSPNISEQSCIFFLILLRVSLELHGRIDLSQKFVTFRSTFERMEFAEHAKGFLAWHMLSIRLHQDGAKTSTRHLCNINHELEDIFSVCENNCHGDLCMGVGCG